MLKKAVEWTACVSLFGVCLLLLRIHGYLEIPRSVIVCVFIVPAVAWLIVGLLTFVTCVICIIMREQEKNSRQKLLNKSTMAYPLYLVRRKSDGKYLRGTRLWRWTRFRCFAARCYESTSHIHFRLGCVDEDECELVKA